MVHTRLRRLDNRNLAVSYIRAHDPRLTLIKQGHENTGGHVLRRSIKPEHTVKSKKFQ